MVTEEVNKWTLTFSVKHQITSREMKEVLYYLKSRVNFKNLTNSYIVVNLTFQSAGEIIRHDLYK